MEADNLDKPLSLMRDMDVFTDGMTITTAARMALLEESLHILMKYFVVDKYGEHKGDHALIAHLMNGKTVDNFETSAVYEQAYSDCVDRADKLIGIFDELEREA